MQGRQFGALHINHREFLYSYFRMVFQAMRQFWWNLAEIGPVVAEKKALEIEQMDTQTDTQLVFIV